MLAKLGSKLKSIPKKDQNKQLNRVFSFLKLGNKFSKSQLLLIGGAVATIGVVSLITAFASHHDLATGWNCNTGQAYAGIYWNDDGMGSRGYNLNMSTTANFSTSSTKFVPYGANTASPAKNYNTSTNVPEGLSPSATLKFGETYYIRVQYVASGEYTPVTNIKYDCSTPALAAAPTISGYCSNDGQPKATVSWAEAGQGSQGYYVDVDRNNDWSDGYNAKPIPAGTTQTVIPDGLANGSVDNNLKTYYVHIEYRATSNATATATWVIPSCDPPPSGQSAAPLVSIKCNNNKAEATISWTKREAPKSYSVEIDDNNNWEDGYWYRTISNASATAPYTIAPDGFTRKITNTSDSSGALTFRKSTTFQVRLNLGANYGYSKLATLEGLSCTEPNPPSQPAAPTVALSCTNGKSEATISWQGSSATVDIDNNNNWGDGYWNKKVDNLTSTKAPDGFNQYGTTSLLELVGDAKYQVRTYNGTINSGTASFTALKCAAPSPPPAPTVIVACEGGKSVATISWQGSTIKYVDVDSNNIWDDGYWNKSTNGLTNTKAPEGFNQYGDRISTPLELVGNETYRVRTYNGTANSTISSFKAAKCVNAPPPSAQTSGGLSIEPYCLSGLSKANINWNAKDNAAGYYVDIDNNNNFNDGFWNKYANLGQSSTPAPDGFSQYGTATPLTLISGSTYYVRLYYVATGKHTLTTSFKAASNCFSLDGKPKTESCNIWQQIFLGCKP